MNNNLTPAQVERLVKLQEELNEAGKEVCKILLHGFVAADGVTYDNRSALQKELGDVIATTKLLTDWGDLDDHQIYVAATAKDQTITRYMKHQRDAWVERTAWELLCSDTARGMYQYDHWDGVPAALKYRYLKRARALARVREESTSA